MQKPEMPVLNISGMLSYVCHCCFHISSCWDLCLGLRQ